MIERDVMAELKRLPAFEEDAELGPQDADSLRWHAKGIRARARYYEDKGEPMAPVSIRWLRVLAMCLETGADSMESPNG